jgi:hypothetical protein
VIAARREVDDFARRSGGEHEPRRLGRDRSLEVDLVQQQRLDQLRLDAARGDAQQRLARERDRALGHRVDAAGEAEAGEVVKERVRKPEAAQVRKLVGSETHLLDERQRGSDARDEQPVAVRRQIAREQLEHRRLVHAAQEVAGRHRQLVLVHHHRGLCRGEQPGIVDRRGGHPPLRLRPPRLRRHRRKAVAPARLLRILALVPSAPIQPADERDEVRRSWISIRATLRAARSPADGAGHRPRRGGGRGGGARLLFGIPLVAGGRRHRAGGARDVEPADRRKRRFNAVIGAMPATILLAFLYETDVAETDLGGLARGAVPSLSRAGSVLLATAIPLALVPLVRLADRADAIGELADGSATRVLARLVAGPIIALNALLLIRTVTR